MRTVTLMSKPQQYRPGRPHEAAAIVMLFHTLIALLAFIRVVARAPGEVGRGASRGVIAEQPRHTDDRRFVLKLYGHPDRERAIYSLLLRLPAFERHQARPLRRRSPV